jgi:phosphoribosyl 1,2-cyclic phosphodiesterase
MPSSNELRFCPLFSGSSGNALYVGFEGTHLLIDAGMSGAKITSELARIGLSPDQLTAILITHEHSDHISGAGILSRKYDLPIFANEGTWEAMRAKLGNISEKNVCVFETGTDFPIDSLDITPFAIPHDAADPVGYSICTQNVKLCIATDLGTVKESWLRHLEHADLVLLESNHDVDMLKASRYRYELKRRILGNKGHLSNDAAGKAALELYKRGVRAIILGHLSGENNFPELAYQSVCCVLQQEGISPGEDLLLSVASRDGCNATYVLGGTSGMKMF